MNEKNYSNNHISHSQIETFKNCPYRYKLSYIDNLTCLPDYEKADNALLLGLCIHRAIEINDIKKAINEYYMSFPIINNDHISEALKMELILEKTLPIVPFGEHEVCISSNQKINYLGYIDLLVKNNDGTHDIYDFKYINIKNIQKYIESPQLSIYKYFAEKNGYKIRDLHFLFIPKLDIKCLKTETVQQYRNRIIEESCKLHPTIMKVQYQEELVKDFFNTITQINNTTVFEKSHSLCFFCGFNKYCESKGNINYMVLPKNEKRDISKITHRKLFIYGAPFSGKSTFVDAANDVLNINTDGNYNFLSSPVVVIKDEVTTNGRLVNRKFAWDVFKETIEELEKGQNDFKTIVIDLVDDIREYCRLYIYDKLKIQHETDAGYGKGFDMIKTEFLSVMKRFFNLPYENLIIISHEDTSKDITKKSGMTVTRIKPNIQESLALKLAGMVDIVARVVVEEDGSRTLNFKSDEVVFGGGRLKGLKTTKIPLKWSEFVKVYDDVNNATSPINTKEPENNNTPKNQVAEATPERAPRI